MAQTDVEQREDALFVLARYATGLRFEDLPSDVVEVTKKGILDTLAVILAASGTMAEVKTLVDLMRDIGGKKESTVLGFGDRLPAWHAGYVNGAMGHCLDYDDMHAAGAGHIHAPVVPAALAMAERQGGVSGKDFIASVALGVDILCRLGLTARAGGARHEWYIMPMCGVFGAAGACGKIIRLNDDQMVNALGIAFTQAAGTMEIVYGLNSNIRGISHAPPGEVGVRAALMAQKGITGVRSAIEGKAGLINVYYGGKYDRVALVGEFGKRWAVLDDGFKPWPSCGFTHIYIDTTLELVKRHNVTLDQVEAVNVVVGDFARDLCEPLELKRKPPTTMNAKFSIPFTVSTAIARRKVVIGDFVGKGLEDQAVLELAKKVNYRFDPKYNFNAIEGMPAGYVEIKTRDGGAYSLEQRIAYGHPGKPMSWEDLASKFRDCAAYSASPLPRGNVENAIGMLTDLEHVSDVSKIVKLLAGKRAKANTGK